MSKKKFTNTKSTRRNFIGKLAISTSFVFAVSKLLKYAEAALLPTPSQGEGPFYPIEKPLDQDADLTFVDSRKEQALGDVHIVQGRVLNRSGKPASNALVEIWQANKWGRYQDKRDQSSLPWDKNFQGYGRVQTDDEGRYVFKTIKPAGYSQGAMQRPPHIHFKVNLGGYDELITQMYFAGEPKNKMDLILSETREKEQLIIKFTPLADGKKIGNFDLFLH